MGPIGSKVFYTGAWLSPFSHNWYPTRVGILISAAVLLLYNDTKQCVFMERLVLFKTMILIKQIWLTLSATTDTVSP